MHKKLELKKVVMRNMDGATLQGFDTTTLGTATSCVDTCACTAICSYICPPYTNGC